MPLKTPVLIPNTCFNSCTYKIIRRNLFAGTFTQCLVVWASTSGWQTHFTAVHWLAKVSANFFFICNQTEIKFDVHVRSDVIDVLALLEVTHALYFYFILLRPPAFLSKEEWFLKLVRLSYRFVRSGLRYGSQDLNRHCFDFNYCVESFLKNNNYCQNYNYLMWNQNISCHFPQSETRYQTHLFEVRCSLSKKYFSHSVWPKHVFLVKYGQSIFCSTRALEQEMSNYRNMFAITKQMILWRHLKRVNFHKTINQR